MSVLTRTQLPEAGNSASLARQTRRGATSMEYLMMLSLIIVVLLATIAYLGTSNRASMSNSADTIDKNLNKGG